MPALIGKKLGMTQVFEKDGTVVPVTVIQADPTVVVRKRTQDVDGYTAVQIGWGVRKEKHTSRPLAGYFRSQGVEPRRYLREVRVDDPSPYEQGQELTVELFEPGTLIDIVGVSKGKGFQGVVKRHGFGAGKETHGSKTGRLPGSVGQSAYPGRVLKGKKLPGRMGGKRVTQRNLKVVGIDKDRHLIWVRGAVPGARGGVLMLQPAVAATPRARRRAAREAAKQDAES
ncbi:MAG: 50S ribosomal protein L3 [Candidatus Eiseniibacteriota bacterium]|jgi:large subunit ribosomal protein L3